VLLARVAIPVPLGRTFTYRVSSAIEPGARVLCQFGPRRVVGVVLDVAEREPEIEVERLRDLGPALDPRPVLPRELLEFLLELGRYYLAPLGEVMRLALPAVERSVDPSERLTDLKVKLVGRPVQSASRTDTPLPARLSSGRRTILQHLESTGPCHVAELERRFPGARAKLKGLAEQNLVALTETILHHDPYFAAPVARDHKKDLNAEQSLAVERIRSALQLGEPSAFLLHGVTGSGKTEVYLNAVEECLSEGRGALILVPEIALTPQLVGRFRARFGDGIAVVHSGLVDSERHRMWQGLRAGALRVAVGARSALFAPVDRLGLVCVDEEHDPSFKQEEGVRYNARDMALLRARRAGAVAVLGSATPQLASQAAVERGQLECLRLTTRAVSGAELPSIEVVDLRRMGPGPSQDRQLTVPLLAALEQVLLERRQAILFLNRRGFAPALLCDSCGHLCRCPDCSVALTVHRVGRARLVCHYCDYHAELPRSCPKCESERLTEEGAGTERIEQALVQLFPQARIARLDRDVASHHKSESVLLRMRRGEIDILVGTQMVTKGHDLSGVSLVGVLDADAALSLPDFRASERTFQLLVQVAGRAGRNDARGRVLIQTRQPEAAAVRYAVNHDVDGFTAEELAARRELAYPPFAHLALVRCEALDQRLAERKCQALAALARRVARPEVQILGPAAAPLARLRARYRYRFLLRSTERRALRDILLEILRTESDRRVRVLLDVDPINML